VPLSIIPAGLVYGDRARFRHSVLLRLGEPVPFGDLTDRGLDHGTVAELTTRIRAAILPLTLHGSDERHLALAQDVAWLLAEAPGNRVDLDALRARVQSVMPHLAALSELEYATLETRVQAAQAWLRTKGLRPDQVGHPYAGSEIGRWLPGAALRLVFAAGLLVPSLLFWPPYRMSGWIAERFTDEGDLTATLKLLSGLLLHPAWALLLVMLTGWRWGWGFALWPLAALLAATLGHPLLERASEDLQAIRGFLWRRDAAVPELLEARRQLLKAFPELGTR
jgi:hypothetical protein